MQAASHCSDEELVAHMDGELPSSDENKVQNHLHACWRCRARLSRLEEQARFLTDAYAEQTFPGPHRIAEAKQRVLARYELWERGAAGSMRLLGAMGRRPRFSLRPYALGGAAASILALAAWLFLDGRPAAEVPVSRDLVEIAARAEQALYKTDLTVHQVFRVTVEEVVPRPERRVSRLELWSEARTGRYASRWKDESGVLKLACWRPDREREFAYEPSGSAPASAGRPHMVRAAPMVELARAGRGTMAMEAWLWRWLKSRPWEPVLLTTALEEFRDGDIELKVERNGIPGGGPPLVIAIERTVDGIRARLVVELDPASYRPRMQTVRFEANGRIIQWRMELERAEVIRPASLAAGIFEPDASLLRSRKPVSAPPVGPDSPAPAAESSAAPVAFPSEAELDRLELRAMHVLHRTGACMGEPVKVTRNSSGVMVRGMLESPARKRELLANLAPLQVLPLFAVELTATDENAQTELPQAAADTARSEPSVRVANGELKAAKHLASYFGRHSGPEDTEDVQRQVNRFSTESLNGAHDLLAHTWAVLRIAERFPEDRMKRLDTGSLDLLEAMLRSHLGALERGADQLNRQLREPLLPMAAETGFPAGEWIDPPGEWRLAAQSLLAEVRRTDALIASLFAGAEVPLESEDHPRSPVRVPAAEEQAAALLWLLPQVRDAAAAAAAEVVLEFSEAKLLTKRR